MTDTDFAALIEGVARKVWGEPNKEYSNSRELRWGGGGGRIVYLDGGGNWIDHTEDASGGVLDLVEHTQGLDRKGAIAWLQDEGLIDGRNSSQAPSQESSPPVDDRAPPERDEPKKEQGKWTEVDEYDYTDPDGKLVYQVVRIQWKLADGSWRLNKSGKVDKSFVQRRKSGLPDGSWVFGLSDGEFMRRSSGQNWTKFDEKKFSTINNGERRHFESNVSNGLYRWPQIEIAIFDNKPVILVEGEKDVHTAEKLGFAGTTNSGGAGNWTEALVAVFRDADVVIAVDNDKAGCDRGDVVAKSLSEIARSVKVLDLAQVWKSIPEKADLTDWHEQGGTAEQLASLIGKTPKWSLPKPASKFSGLTWSELDNPGLQHEWLVKGLIERRSVGVVAGPSKSGKSFFMVDLALAVAQGRPYCKRKTVQGLVLYQAGEGGPGLKKRLKGYRIENGLSINDDIPFVLLPSSLDLYTNDDPVNLFIDEAKKWAEWSPHNLEMVVIDTLSAASAGANENASEDIGRILARCNRIAEELRCTVVLVHHMNAEGKRLRGHTSLGANVANVIEIKKLEISDENGRPIRKAALDKNKDGDDNVSWRFVLRQIILGEDEDGDKITTCVLDSPSGGDDSEVTTQWRLTAHEKVVYEALLNTITTHGIPVPAGLNISSAVNRVVTYKLWASEVGRTWAFGDTKAVTDAEIKASRASELKAVMKRVGTSLYNSGVLGRDNDKGLVWWTGIDVKGKKRKSDQANQPPELGLEGGSKAIMSDPDAPF